MNHTALRYFVEVADCHSIRQAANRLHVAASAISRQIANLEHELGAELIERGPSGIRLTAAGEVVAQHCRSTFREFQRIRALVDDLKGLRRGQIDIFCVEGLVVEFLPRVLAAFHGENPGIDYRVVTAPTDRIIEAIVKDECDFGITINAIARPDIKTVASRTDTLEVVIAPGHPLAERASITVEEAAAYPMALLQPSFGARQFMDAQFARRGLAPRELLTSNSVVALKAMVQHGGALTFMSPMFIGDELSRGVLCARPVTPEPLGPYRLEVQAHRDRRLPFAAHALLSHLERALN
ncbi:LysR family transcriptional regulator [Xanthobacter sp. YC-JY1]|uniref:LysR family transcriptional regulator n=1 Tax=Xanthobacter sp. YC-JY1 TaxID=2419844 RepID=UPI001F1D22AD|nr:LysR family transcriptional regulator [Xanthobacter sp. YC-JY1]UJX47293.1 LysR family transcriptional regulator [Xanthobacter sp. YC-JY1]